MTPLQRESGIVERRELHPSNFDARSPKDAADARDIVDTFESRVATTNALKGGQGRTARDLEADYFALAWCLIVLAVGAFWALVLWTIGGGR